MSMLIGRGLDDWLFRGEDDRYECEPNENCKGCWNEYCEHWEKENKDVECRNDKQISK